MRILSTLDSAYSYNKTLKNLLLDVYGPEQLLTNKFYRGILFDFLKEHEAEVLARLLGYRPSTSNEHLYSFLKKVDIRRGSTEEELLFRFFSVLPPTIDKKDLSDDVQQIESAYQLFSHQRKAAREVIEYLNKKPHRVLLHMPTGSGKTRTAMNIISNHFRTEEPTTVVWLAASEELCEQAIEEFQKAWSCLGDRALCIYRCWGEHSLDITSLHDGLVVASMQKLISITRNTGGINFISQLANKCSLVVMDEAHQSIAPKFQLILDTLFYGGRKNKLLGLSATPGRTWNDPEEDIKLANFFSKQKVKLTVAGYDNPVQYLIAERYLAQVEYRNLFHSSGRLSLKDLEDITSLSDVPFKILKKLGEDEQRNLKIIQATEDLLQRHKRIILFAPSVASSNLLSLILKARGHKAYSITSESSPRKRKHAIQDFKNTDSQPKILCNYGVLTTGFDAPLTSAAVIARPTFSLVLYSQMIGRAIRGVRAGGNNESEIVTVIDQQLPGFSSVAEAFENWEDVWK